MSVSNEVPVLRTLTNVYTTQKCPDGLGAIEIISRSSKIAARLYVKNKKVYGIEISNFPMEIIRRIITSEHLSDYHRENLLAVFSQKLDDAKIVDYILENQMLPPGVLISYLKDLFLGACDYVVNIPMAEIRWRTNISSNTIPIPEVELDILWRVLNKRKVEFKRIADSFTLEERQVRNLKFKKSDTKLEEKNQMVANIASIASGEYSILDFAREFGLSLFLAAREISELWALGQLLVFYDNEFIIKPNSQYMEISLRKSGNKPSMNKPVESHAESLESESELVLKELKQLIIRAERIIARLEGRNIE